MIKPLSLCNEHLVALFMDMVMSRFMGLTDSKLEKAKAWYSLLDGWHYKAIVTYRNSGHIEYASFDIPEKDLKQIFKNKTA
jgi:hypothetical protein